MHGAAQRLCAGLAGVLLCAVAVPAQAWADMGPSASAGAANGSRPCSAPVLDDSAGGARAVRELGSDLPAAAAEVDMTPAAYRELLNTDPTVRVDECGATFVVEPEHTAGDVRSKAGADSSPGGAAASGAVDASGDAFALHSRPGSQRTIYLDFDGERIVDTLWNESADNADFFATPFDVDGLPTIFSPAERGIVRGVWQQVAEDYAPFDVNVTTQDPGPAAITRTDSTDAVYGTRALVTSDDVVFSTVCQSQCGGIAYLKAFDRTSEHAATQPALIFQQATAPTAKSIAEAASHEVGHNLGLRHDDTPTTGYYAGHGSWAPIMGVGYYRPVSQWSNGEYGAKNHEDDLAVIQNHGLRVLGDDHAGTPSGATALTYAAGTADGLIATRDDVDWFSFTVPAGTASTTVRVTPQAVGANLDTRLDVYDAAGAPLASAYPPVSTLSHELASGLDASVSLSLPAGTYLAKVDGVGFGDSPATGYTDYASLGRYRFSVDDTSAGLSVTTPSLPRATVGEPYSASLDAVGGTAPYTWTSTGVALPPGLSLSSPNVISGTPTAPASLTITLTVKDSAGDATQGVTRSFNVTVDPALVVTTTGLSPATTNSWFTQTLIATGGTGTYAWSLVGGPAWAGLSGSGVLSGTPSGTGSYPVAALVVDGVGRSATTMLTLSVAASPPGVPVEPQPVGPQPVGPQPVAEPQPAGPQPVTYRDALRTAVSRLPVRAESHAGFSAAQFPMVDANGDCQSTRDEVLLAETRRAAQFASSRRCAVRTGRWFSYFDRSYVKAASRVTTVYTVPLAEAWESGARSWSADRRRAYGNDLGDARVIVAVSTTSARARGSKEPTRWLPAKTSRCQYVAQWVAVKIRWGLSVDDAERRRLRSLAAGCTNVRLSVRRA